MKKLILQMVGSAFAFFGVIGMLTPIPFGVVFFVIGLLFLIPTTPVVAGWVRGARRRIRVLDSALSAATNRMPYPYRRILRETELSPDY